MGGKFGFAGMKCIGKQGSAPVYPAHKSMKMQLVEGWPVNCSISQIECWPTMNFDKNLHVASKLKIKRERLRHASVPHFGRSARGPVGRELILGDTL